MRRRQTRQQDHTCAFFGNVVLAGMRGAGVNERRGVGLTSPREGPAPPSSSSSSPSSSSAASSSSLPLGALGGGRGGPMAAGWSASARLSMGKRSQRLPTRPSLRFLPPDAGAQP